MFKVEKNCPTFRVNAEFQDEDIPVKIEYVENEYCVEGYSGTTIQDVNIENTLTEQDVYAITGIAYRPAHSPYANMETFTWWEYDDKLQQYVDTYILISSVDIQYISLPEIDVMWYGKKEVE